MATEQINQELEDAAEYYYPTDNGQWAHPAYKDAFKKGANWKAEQVANDAIEFISDTMGTSKESIINLYNIWQQTRNK